MQLDEQKPYPNQSTSPETKTLQRLIEVMSTVDLDSPDAILNATTISDGKGGRIFL